MRAICLAAVLATTTSVCAAGAQPSVVVEAGCRDGQPNGAFTVRMRSGQPRVVGAFRDGIRTGTFIFWNAAGTRLAVIPYDEDEASGTIALWHASGKRSAARRLEAPTVRGQPHGERRAWYANGRLRYEATYEHGALGEAKAWDANGRALGDAQARAAVESERRREDADVASLARMIEDHRPRCD